MRMRNRRLLKQRAFGLGRVVVLAALLAAIVTVGCSRSETATQKHWSAEAAASYLDQREAQWSEWPGATRGHGTFCVSCHTALPYALARPVLAKALSEPGSSPQERVLVDNVSKRVRFWDEDRPYYSDKDSGLYKTDESRGTEAILNALILANRDAQQGTSSADTRLAFKQD